MQVRSLGWEDLLEKGMATHSSILVCRIPGTEEPGGVQSMGSRRIRQDSETKQQTATCNQAHFLVEGCCSLQGTSISVNDISAFLSMGRCRELGS